MPRIVGILRKDMAAGLALTGVDVMPVTDTADFKRALLEVVDSRDAAIVVVDAGLLASLDERTAAAVEARDLPLVVAIPGELQWSETQAGPSDDAIALLIRRAVGYQLNIAL